METGVFLKKRLYTAACALVLCAAMALPASAAGGYKDVPDDAWYAQAVADVSEKGYMNGVGYDLFQPDTAVSRAGVVTALWRLEGSPTAGAASFADVGENAWYAAAVAWARESGIASGDGKGAFHPDSPVTRQELAVFLYRYAEHKQWDEAQGALELYSDAGAVSSWAKEGMSYAGGMGLIQGSGGKLTPGGSATRAQLAVSLQRMTTPVMG